MGKLKTAVWNRGRSRRARRIVQIINPVVCED